MVNVAEIKVKVSLFRSIVLLLKYTTKAGTRIQHITEVVL